MNVYIVLYRILGLPSLLDFLKKNDRKKTCESDGYMEISLFSALIGKLSLVVQRAFFAAHLLRLPQHPLDFKGQLR